MARGFANMTPEAHRAASGKGGKRARDKGTARRWDTATATEAGRKGGAVSQARARERREEAAQRASETTDVSRAGGR